MSTMKEGDPLSDGKFSYRQYLRTLWKKAWLIVLATVLFGSGAWAITTYCIEPKYTASIKLYVDNTTDANATNISSGDIEASHSLVDTYIAIIQSDAVLDRVIDELGLEYSIEDISEMMSAGAVNNTELFSVSISSRSPVEAAEIANAIADIAPDKISNIVNGSSVKIVDRAKIPTEASSPDLMLNTIIGALIGCVFAIGTILICALLDTRIRTEADLERLSNLPILGVITRF